MIIRNMYTIYQYGGRSDDLEYMQEVLQKAEKLGDKAYIDKIKVQIEEIKKKGKKEDPRRRKGNICKPGLPTMDRMSCRGDYMSKCVKDPKDNQFKCCSNIRGVLDCNEPIQPQVLAPSPISKVPSPSPLSVSKVPSPVPPSSPPPLSVSKVPSPVLAPLPSLPVQQASLITKVSVPVSVPQASLITKVPSDAERRIIVDYYDLKMSVLKNIEELKRLKVEKDRLIKMTGRVPDLIFSNEQNNLDDCIRDESGKVLRC